MLRNTERRQAGALQISSLRRRAGFTYWERALILSCRAAHYEGEVRHDETSKEHDLPLVRWRRRGRGALLRRNLSRFVRRRSAPRTGRLSLREERRRVDRRVYRHGDSLPWPLRRTYVQAQRSILVSGCHR